MLVESIPVKSTARFEWVIRGAVTGPHEAFDIDLARYPGAAIVPTRGALIPDWLLLVPRTPCLSFASLEGATRREMMAHAAAATAAVVERVGHAIVFEHGAGRFGSQTGCGVDQGHLHIVGLPFGALDYMRRGLTDLHWLQVEACDPWSKIAASTDYLMVMAGSEAWVAEVRMPTSQLLRRRVASFLHLDAEWDYREHAHIENALLTRRYYSGAFGCAVS